MEVSYSNFSTNNRVKEKSPITKKGYRAFLLLDNINLIAFSQSVSDESRDQAILK